MFLAVGINTYPLLSTSDFALPAVEMLNFLLGSLPFPFVWVFHLNRFAGVLWGYCQTNWMNCWKTNTTWTLALSFADRSIRPLFPVGYFYDTQVGHVQSFAVAVFRVQNVGMSSGAVA